MRTETVRKIIILPTIQPCARNALAWAREGIAGYKAPRAVRIVDALPRSAAGKILRREVRAAALADIGATKP